MRTRGPVLGRRLGQSDPRRDVERGDLPAAERRHGARVRLPHTEDVACEQTGHRAAQEGLSKGLRAARTEGHAAEDDLAVMAREGIVLGLVREHRGIAPVKLQVNERRQQGRHLGHDAPLVRLLEALRHSEIDTIGVRLQQRHAPTAQLPAQKPEQFAAPPRHLVGRVDVREPRETHRAQVAIGRVHEELHRRRQRLVREALRRAGGRGLSAGLGVETLLHEPVHEREQHPQSIASRADPVLAHQRGIKARDVGLHDAPRDARREEVQRRAAVRRAVPRLVRRERRPRAQIGPHEQRIEHACRRPRVREPLVPPRRHLREREGRPAEEPREPRCLVNVVRRIAPHALGIRAVHLEHPRSRDLLARRRREAEVPRHSLEAVAWQVTRGEVVPQHGVERVDHLAPLHCVPRAPHSLVRASRRGPLSQP